ncbi:glycosyltransferase [Actinospica sp. MGRD01-02]|uniref:Glycosyltransferase n=1 Tax=Actinospica acidithermotolerans TaxID=2828514 RepID=A0A941EDX0_9ACTN|nr:PIG-L family deacetylase [Actinospica acidithermotolerans]MBR7826009.1 glycosyltransferase [Actinospica acidithermotolerans]
MNTLSTPLCSVVVPTYNRSQLLRHTLESLTRQSLGTDAIEVLVADDGSSDDTAEVAASFQGRLRLRYLAQADEGYRVAAARNLGLRNATAPVTVFLDSGVLLHSGALAAHVESHRSADRPVAVTGYVYCFNENNEDGAEIEGAIDYQDPDSTMALLAAENRWLDLREEFYEKYGDGFGVLPAPWLMWWTCNVSASTAQLREVGGFDENYRSWGAEDVDLGYRLHRAGAHFVLNRDAASIHVPHPKVYADNMRTAAGNYRYFSTKFDTPITRLVAPENHFYEINDTIRERRLPSCADYLATPDPDEPSALVFSPHPDDDVIACGGVIARKTGLGARVDVVFVTDGSQSHAAVLDIHEDPAPAELVKIRRAEAEAAESVLGVDPARLHFFEFPDTRLADALPEFRARVLELLGELRTVDEVYLPHDERELNADHRLTGRIVLECLAALGLTPKIYKFVVWDERTESEFGFVNRVESEAAQAGEPGGPDESAAGAGERLIARDIAPRLAVKCAALDEHRTQMSLFAPGQRRPVVPESFQERVRGRDREMYWVLDA